MLQATLIHALLLAAAVSAVPFGASNRLFGGAVKNGPLPPSGTELEVFSHNCSAPPCQVTQIHVPSIYPAGGCPDDWENGRLRVYVDGGVTPTLDVLLLQLAFVGAPAEYEPQTKSSSLFSAGGLFGKNAGTGGVFSTIRIPFGASVRVTMEQAPSCPDHNGVYWIIVRGLEALPLRIAELELPPEARLTVQRLDGQTLQPLEFVTLASSPAGTDGLIFATFFQASSRDPNYLEGACLPHSNPPRSPFPIPSRPPSFFLPAHLSFPPLAGCFRLLGPNGDNSTEQFLSSGTEVCITCALLFSSQRSSHHPPPTHLHLFSSRIISSARRTSTRAFLRARLRA